MAAVRVLLCSATLIALGVIVSLGIYKIHGSALALRIFKRSTNELKPKPFKFPQNYRATGKLYLPHSKIEEPFEVWFSRTHNRSRVDYYYGTDKTFQLADFGSNGEAFKVVPMYDDKKGNYIGCWNLAGTKAAPIVVQPIVPNMTTLQFSRYEIYRGTAAALWEYRYLSYGLLNIHTLWVTKTEPPRPIRYEMKGYDNLLASYYDYYVLEYISFEEWKPDIKKFELPKDSGDSWCTTLANSVDSHLLGNPMQEFMSFGGRVTEREIDKMYGEYKTKHNKTYDSNEEHTRRKHIYRHHMRFIRSINRKNLSYKLAQNHMVDLKEDEYDHHEGAIQNTSTHHKGAVHLQPHHESYSNMTNILKRIDVPDELDWRDYGAVTPVRGQGICGACYALAAVGALEGAYFMKTGSLVELSAQQIIDCSWGSGNHGCRGGYYNKALSWIYLHGIATADSYGPYLAQEGTCHFEGTTRGATLDAFAFVPKHNNTALKISVARFGPAAISINESPLSLKFYSWGIYDDPECDSKISQHSALVVGYGQEKGVPYWLVKNSWSSSWGLDGYIKIAWKGNICGVTRNPVVALMRHTAFQFPVKEKIDFINPDIPDSMGRKIHPVRRLKDHKEKEKYVGNTKKKHVKNPCSKNRPSITRKCGTTHQSRRKNRMNERMNENTHQHTHESENIHIDSIDSEKKLIERSKPYLEKLQDIYRKLENLISSSNLDNKPKTILS